MNTHLISLHTWGYLALALAILIGCPVLVAILKRRKSEWFGLVTAVSVPLFVMAGVLLWNALQDLMFLWWITH